ncbi:protein kinase [Streptomyces sp. NPDC091279]|uniref:protein kinase n=1 Tax=Streptomyces sp. NPDC091279 TaxID=3365983 RepID=UPI003817FDEE
MHTDLPDPAILALIQEHTGPVSELRCTAGGFSSDLTALVGCEKGAFFVKAVRNRPGGRRDSLLRERLVNASVRSLSPPLLWDVEDDGWVVLGFEAVEGRDADFAPGSLDLPLVVDAVARVGRLPLPEVARDWRETRWDRFARDRSEAELFQGDSLLHTDVNPSNFLVGERELWVVDWSWPTRGAGFLDPALLAVQLIASGHTPASAEGWVARCPAWQQADPAAIDAFAGANSLMGEAFLARKPDAGWLRAMAEACRAWAGHRGGGVEQGG